MGNPQIIVNSYNDNFAEIGHVNVTFVDGDGNHLGTYGNNVTGFQGVRLEDESRVASQRTAIEFTDQTQSAWTNALRYAQETAKSAEGGNGEYTFIGDNCYDFVDMVFTQANHTPNTAFQYVDHNIAVYNYGWIQYQVTNAWNSFYNALANNPDFAYAARERWDQHDRVVAQQGSEEDEIVVTGRRQQAENETWMSPVAVDLKGDGFSSIDLERSSVIFTYDGEGPGVRTAWLGADDGFVALDRNGNGEIDDGRELFGGGLYGEGFDALAKLDDNQDGQIDRHDHAYHQLLIWTDRNSDGKSQTGELARLADVGVESISVLAEKASAYAGPDAFIAQTSSAQVNGQTVQTADIFFRLGGLAA